MNVSIVIPVLNSHEIVRRQLLHFERIGLPEGMELLLIDDGSDPPLTTTSTLARIIPTHDTRPWTWALARNLGAKLARGKYLLMVDVDYILPRAALDAASSFTGDKLRFRRQLGILDEAGMFHDDLDTLRKYGLPEERITHRQTRLPPHPNNFCIRADLYWKMGGYREDCLDKPYPQGEDRWFKQRWIELVNAGLAVEDDPDLRPMIYMFPNGQFCNDVDFNPFGLFHNLSRKTDQNPAHLKILARQ